MQVVVLASDSQKKELLLEEKEEITWISNEQEFLQHQKADAFVDLLYSKSAERNLLLRQLLPKPVIINSVTDTLPETDASFIRMNGWPTFLSSPVVEAASKDGDKKAAAEAAFSLLNKRPEWLADEPGFITPRVVSLIINEAYLTLAEGVSTKEEINTAMKLGTAYPYGPFEWAEKIGAGKIAELLKKLCQKQARYTPAFLLVQEAPQST